ncbi:MAG TPA: hypothetical protein VHQ47_15545 [Phycisphaerae bacterium]|jgi:hypothetical protein|nr:hypothetical protein [Phycisphaerae bacterium]
MKFSLGMMALAVMLLPLGGCETLTMTPAEHINKYAHVVDTNLKEIPTDIDRELLLDHPSWMAKAPIPNE